MMKRDFLHDELVSQNGFKVSFESEDWPGYTNGYVDIQLTFVDTVVFHKGERTFFEAPVSDLDTELVIELANLFTRIEKRNRPVEVAA